MDNRVLIIGGAGFIGRNLCRHLCASGYRVTCFDLGKAEQPMEDVEYVTGDFFNEKVLEEVIRDKDFIIHAVSTINPGNSNEKYMWGYQKDFLQTVKLCHMLVGKNSKLIFLSSGGTVYGNQKKQPIAEENLPRPINHYGNIKLCIENTIKVFNYQMHNKMLIVRISNPYGVGQDYKKGVGFVDAVLKNSLCGRPVEIWGDGENIRDYIYIDDVCKMIMALLDYNGEYDIFNISSGTGVSQNQIIELARQFGMVPKVIYRKERTVDVRKIVLDNTRIRSIYKWNITKLEEGMFRYYEFLKKHIESFEYLTQG